MKVSKLLLGFSIAIAFAVCVASAIPAFATCADWCLANRCTRGDYSGNIPGCMNACVPACQKKHGKTQ